MKNTIFPLLLDESTLGKESAEGTAKTILNKLCWGFPALSWRLSTLTAAQRPENMEVVTGALQQQASILAVFRFAGFGSPAGLPAALGIPAGCTVLSVPQLQSEYLQSEGSHFSL